jgi:hypothetical protein
VGVSMWHGGGDDGRDSLLLMLPWERGLSSLDKTLTVSSSSIELRPTSGNHGSSPTPIARCNSSK